MIVLYLVPVVVIPRIRSQFKSYIMHDCSCTLTRSLAGATGKAGNGKRDGNRKGDGTRTGNMIQNQRQDDLWLVEILLTNDESQ